MIQPFDEMSTHAECLALSSQSAKPRCFCEKHNQALVCAFRWCLLIQIEGELGIRLGQLDADLVVLQRRGSEIRSVAAMLSLFLLHFLFFFSIRMNLMILSPMNIHLVQQPYFLSKISYTTSIPIEEVQFDLFLSIWPIFGWIFNIFLFSWSNLWKLH